MNFVIVAPRYASHSNGIKIMHILCGTLNDLGHDARLMFIDETTPDGQGVFFHDATWTDSKLNTPVLKKEDKAFIKTAFVMYPETISDNPLNAGKILRYFGNRESYCNGQKIRKGAKDFIVAHSRVIAPDAHILFYAALNPVFNDEGSPSFDERRLNVTYIGKGDMYGKTGIMPRTLYVARQWPVNQDQFALLLRQTRIFYTWDAWTAANVEAVLCGAVPVIVSYGPWKPEDIDSSEIGPLPRAVLKDDGQVYFNSEEFYAQKAAMLEKIKDLVASWEARVIKFTEAVAAHFKD